MKILSSDAMHDRATQTTERSNLSSLRNLSAAALITLVGCGSRESNSSADQTNSRGSRDNDQALVIPQPALEPEPRQLPISAKLHREQEWSHTYPSELAIGESLRMTRSFISEAVSDTQSVEMPLGQLRPGYTSHDEGKERQRQIISIIARHASTTEDKVLESISRDHRTYFENFEQRNRADDLEKYTGNNAYKSERGKLEDSITSTRAAMLQALQDMRVDKIDHSLSLLRELKTLVEARDNEQPHDEKKLKTLSRMCSAKSLEEVTEHIFGLERLRSGALGPAFHKAQAERQEQLKKLTQDLDAMEEKMNLRWCADYDRMTAAFQELEGLQAQLRIAPRTPNQVGELINVSQHDDFKVDLAAYRLRNCKLEVYTLRDASRNSVATICDQGTAFDESTRKHSVLIAIDEPHAAIRIKAHESGGSIEASNGAHFERKEIDLKAAARSEIEGKFTPTFIAQSSTPLLPLKGDRHEISVKMNPGGILDLSGCANGTSTKITTEGSGIFVVGESDPQRGRVPVTVKGTLKGEAPLLIALPEKLSLSDITIGSISSSEWRLTAGNADFTIERSSTEGVLTNVDIELQTPRGPLLVAIIRDGDRVLKD